MKKYLYLLLICCWTVLYGFSIPKFYHGRIFLDEPRFSEKGLFTADVTFGSAIKHFQSSGYKGRFKCSELYLQAYQNFSKGIFVHAFLPFAWINLDDIERYDPAIRPLPQHIQKADLYSPSFFLGWTLNYENMAHLDYIDLTCEVGAILNSPSGAIHVPLFPIGYTTQPGFAGAAYTALGALEWLTLGAYVQAISYQPATIWSVGSYVKLDHLVPKISLILAFCGDGQNKQIETISPWQMFSIDFSVDVDLATDERPWLPRLRAFYTKPISGFNILKVAMGGFNAGVDVQIFY